MVLASGPAYLPCGIKPSKDQEDEDAHGHILFWNSCESGRSSIKTVQQGDIFSGV